MVHDTLFDYPDLNEDVKIHTNYSKFQLRAVIIRKENPIVFYSRKLTDVQKRYTVTEKEFLIIAKTIKYFENILINQILIIYIDNKKTYM